MSTNKQASDQIDSKLLERCGRIATSTWSDALDTLKINGVVQGISQRAGQGRVVGEAVTARQKWGELGAFKRSELSAGKLIEALGPGKILVVDVGGKAISTFGGMASTAAQLRGAAAVMIDGACRDLDEIKALDLWMASRHVTPLSGKTRLQLQEMGGQVVLGGVSVNAGDLIVGDETGIVVIPRNRLQELLAAAENLLAVDERTEKAVRQGVNFNEALTVAGDKLN